MPVVNNTEGKVFNNWKVIKELGKGKILCECLLCGSIKERYKKAIISGKSKSCGCDRKAVTQIIVGELYGNWKVLQDVGNSQVLCECQCENKTTAVLYKKALKEGSSKSCGCLRAKLCAETKEKNDTTGRGNTKYLHQRFGLLTVVGYKDNKAVCNCDCGTKGILVYSSHLLDGSAKSCGCFNETFETKWKDKKFGFWTVIGKSDTNSQKVKVRCVCGKETEVYKVTLSRGQSKSCGCMSSKLCRGTMIEKYGDTCTLKIDNAREDWQIEAVSSADKMLELINKYDHKPRIYELSDALNINNHSVLTYIHKYNLEDYIDYDYSTSQVESEIYDFIQNITSLKIETKVRGLFDSNNQLEVDIYIPEKKVGIEVNGDYWHSEYFKDKKYHQLKTLELESKGIRLIHVFEHEWVNNKKKVMMLLYEAISNNFDIIYARKCKVQMIDAQEAYRFETLFHFQGKIASELNIGLLLDNKLIGLMTFGKSRFTDEHYEMLRLCYDYHYKVIGGTQKMFKYFIDNFLKDNESCVTYCDITKFSGNTYKNLGFTQVCITDPNYFWVNGKYEALTRYQCQKHKLLEQGYGDYGNTEVEIMHARKYFRVYNSGNKKFKFTKGETEYDK